MEKFNQIIETAGPSERITETLVKVKTILDAMMHDVNAKLALQL